MTESVGQRLEHDHRRIDDDFERFVRSWGGDEIDRDAYSSAAVALRHHIYVEEEFHFPVLRAAGLLGPILVMLREHGEIWGLLDQVEAALGDDDAERVKELWPALASVLEQHNAKEERILYPAGDGHLSPADAALVLEQLANGEVPPDWTCEMAGHRA